MEWIPDYVQEVDDATLFVLITSIVMLTGMVLFALYCFFRFRKGKNPQADQSLEGHTGIEIAWTVISTIIVMIMFYWGYIGFRDMRKPPKNAMKVRVIARQWSWTFEYENGKVSDVLVVPKGKPVLCEIVSKDVVHSFYLPVYRIKEDAVPGLVTYCWFYPDKQGEFDIFCAEYCGDRHAFMLSKLKVVSPAEFQDWVEQKTLDGRQILQVKGCLACHSLGREKKIGPGFAGLFGSKRKVVTNGKERTVTADEVYIRESILNPKKDVVQGFDPVMPPQDLSEEEINAVIEFLKTLK